LRVAEVIEQHLRARAAECHDERQEQQCGFHDRTMLVLGLLIRGQNSRLPVSHDGKTSDFPRTNVVGAEPTVNSNSTQIAVDAPHEDHSRVISDLLRAHNGALVSFLAARLHNAQDARDVAQEAYVRLLQLDAPGALSFLRGYLFKIAENLAIDRLRHRALRER